ncbi:bifunctional diaminohydroxyphosphoribosylaminopyrimidine deaminase/5-amino-6-(5-phosphoribosylamino)uracil reductase RibD [Marmoricola sp. OAE513]|uniref:bifunctional diaminohydroxyphosphoribosylaminopyrimidine deaminase/5-amino-6-(5-phosphoribosylamino)uracil reductase RibD n=1 Tax=Marmoricola sp. OAE513 TaxID=2817894 RepID=UPI001AE3617C
MRRALELAATSGVPHGPNPRVGCVLLATDGSVIAEGFHRGAGTAHAEAAALAAAYELAGPEAARGATAVVTLEPCNHTGRTGPCARALVNAGVARVVFAQPDPNPLAAGGAATLREAGIAVETGLLERESRRLNRAWTFALEHGRPFVTWKLAATLDGRSAAADGSSRWITGEEARRDVHRLRAECDAILVGTGTALTDDPALTVRDEVGELVGLQPLRVVVGERELPPGARLLDGSAETVHLQTRDVAGALAELHELGIQHVFLEGGPTLGAAFLAAGRVDEVVAYVAPKLLGSGRSAVADLGIESITGALELEVEDVTVLGHDVRFTGRPRHHGKKD